ncbi:MAG: UPF0175 family protein [Spirulinaceae cyanobacterium]
MQVAIEIPQRLDKLWGNLSDRLLERLVADAYSCGEISTAEVRQILKLPSRLATHSFLQKMGVYLNYDEVELEEDLQTLEKLRN